MTTKRQGEMSVFFVIYDININIIQTNQFYPGQSTNVGAIPTNYISLSCIILHFKTYRTAGGSAVLVCDPNIPGLSDD